MDEDKDGTKTKYRGLSLFSCSGIVEYLIKDSKKLEIVLANELKPDRAKIYKYFYPECKMIEGDIAEKCNEIIKEAKNKNVDFVIATPPPIF